MTPTKLIILTGASGAGKTTIANRIAVEASRSVKCLYFNSIGVPSAERMVAEFGSGWMWQKVKTLEWIKRIHCEFLSVGKPVLFEGQMQVPHIIEACEVAGVTDYEIVLIDCDDLSRENRLRFNRLRPELANERMMNWAGFLKNQALAVGARILDSSGSSIEHCVYEILALLDLRHFSRLAIQCCASAENLSCKLIAGNHVVGAVRLQLASSHCDRLFNIKEL